MKKLLISTSLLFSVSALTACGGTQSPDNADSTANMETVPQAASEAPGAVQGGEKATPVTEPDMAGRQHSNMEEAEIKPAAKATPTPGTKPAKSKDVPSSKPAPVVSKEKAPMQSEAEAPAGHDMIGM